MNPKYFEKSIQLIFKYTYTPLTFVLSFQCARTYITIKLTSGNFNSLYMTIVATNVACKILYDTLPKLGSYAFGNLTYEIFSSSLSHSLVNFGNLTSILESIESKLSVAEYYFLRFQSFTKVLVNKIILFQCIRLPYMQLYNAHLLQSIKHMTAINFAIIEFKRYCT